MYKKRPLVYQSMGLLEFQERFPEDRECYKYLVRIRFPAGFLCPRCGSSASWWIETRGLWECKRCRFQISVTAGTMFHRTHTTLRQWFWAIFLVAKDKRGHSALQLSKELNIPYRRAWLILHKIRAAMSFRDSLYQLNGIVEMDEAYFGSPNPGKRGRGTKQTKALVAVGLTENEKPRFLKIQVVKRLDSECVKSFAIRELVKGSVIRTDGLNIYRCLSGLGFSHDPSVVSGKNEHDILHWTHIVISNAKAFIQGTFHGLDKKYFHQYLQEFCYRFNRRSREAELFDRLLLACVMSLPMTHSELTA